MGEIYFTLESWTDHSLLICPQGLVESAACSLATRLLSQWILTLMTWREVWMVSCALALPWEELPLFPTPAIGSWVPECMCAEQTQLHLQWRIKVQLAHGLKQRCWTCWDQSWLGTYGHENEMLIIDHIPLNLVYFLYSIIVMLFNWCRLIGQPFAIKSFLVFWQNLS